MSGNSPAVFDCWSTKRRGEMATEHLDGSRATKAEMNLKHVASVPSALHKALE